MDFSFVIKTGSVKLKITGSAGETASLWYYNEDGWHLISGGISFAEMQQLEMSLNMVTEAMIDRSTVDEFDKDEGD